MTKYKNIEMEQMLGALQKHLDRRDVIGYAAARNTRVLRDELSEYADMRDSLVAKYGQPQMNEEGEPTGYISLPFESEDYPKFLEELGVYASIEHEPSIFRLKFEQAVGVLSGTELLEIEWMFED